jgi:hypothetical protein
MAKIPSDIQEMLLPVPPGFEQVMGYPGNRKWVAFFWTPYGDELEFDDGYSSGTIDWPGWLAFVRHRLVRPLIKAYDFGSSDSDPVHCLLLDRQKRQFYVGEKKAVHRFLETFTRQIQIKTEPVEVSLDQLNQMRDFFENGLQEQKSESKIDDLQKIIASKNSRVEKMVGWLDATYNEIMGGGGEVC